MDSFGRDVRTELVRLLRAPTAELGIVAGNAVQVCVGWFVLPKALKDWLFPSVPGPLAFAIVLLIWMMGDVTSTNMLGNDAPAALAALTDETAIRRLMRVKVTALALLIGPPCAVTAIIIGLGSRHSVTGVGVAPLLLAVPLAVPAVASWVGILLPYRVHTLRWRWEHRRPLRQTVRWAVLLFTPYTLVSTLTAVFIAGPFVLATHLTGIRHRGRPSDTTLAIALPIAIALSVGVFLLATTAAGRIAMRRQGRLVSYFSDPEAG